MRQDWVVYGIIASIFVYLWGNGIFLNPVFKSEKPNIHYYKLTPYKKPPYDTGERQPPERFNGGITYYEAMNIDKPILMFGYNHDCDPVVSDHMKELIYPIAALYKDSFTFVFKISNKVESYSEVDPFYETLDACQKGNICAIDRKKKFSMSFYGNENATSDEIKAALDDFIVRSSKL